MPIRILIVEDIPTDAELAMRELDRELGTSQYKIVTEEEEYREALDHFGPDLIISDYMLPRFDGMRALHIAVNIRPEIPFIVFTGSTNEDTAVACMKAGAWDYVIKEHIKRLGPAAAFALKEKETHLEKKRAEEALFRAGKEWRATFDAMKDMIFVTNPDGVILRANTAFKKYADRPWSGIIGEPCHTILGETRERTDLCPLTRTISSREREESETNINGVWYRSVVDPVVDRQGRLLEVIHILTDIGAAKRLETSLRKNEEKLKTIFENTPVIMMVVDNTRRVREMNKAGEVAAGLRPEHLTEPRPGETLHCVHALDDPRGCGYGPECGACVLRNTILETLETRKPHANVEAEMIFSPPGSSPGRYPSTAASTRTYLLHTAPLDIEDERLVLVILDDISEIKRTQRELESSYEELTRTRTMIMEQERLRAVGQIASGIAHDINNTLAPITLYVDALLDTEETLSERAERYLTTIRKSVGDIEHVVNRLRAFYRKEEENHEDQEIVVEELFDDVMEITRPRWKDIPNKNGLIVECRREIADELPVLLGDRSEIRESLINLLFNAVDALPEGGKIVLKAYLRDGAIVLEVTDTGIGMNEEEREHSIEPFFTTKGVEGSGLGLAMVYGMSQRHGADMEIESVPGAGTTVRLVFPSVKKENEKKIAGSGRRISRPLRLLLIDDDERVRNVLEEMLILDGHAVLSESCGENGIDLLLREKAAGNSFDLVLTDLGMPGMDGTEVGNAVKRNAPDTAVILLTGWGTLMEEVPPENIDLVLSKPPTMERLRTAIWECLEPRT